MDEPILGMEGEEKNAHGADGGEGSEEGEEGKEGKEQTGEPPLVLTHHASAMVMRRFKLREEETLPFVEHHLLVSGPGRKRRDGALRFTSEENVQVVTKAYPHCTLVLTCYPLPVSRTWRKDRKVRRKPVDYTEVTRQKRMHTERVVTYEQPECSESEECEGDGEREDASSSA